METNQAQVCLSQNTLPFDNVNITYSVETPKLEFHWSNYAYFIVFPRVLYFLLIFINSWLSNFFKSSF